MVIMAACAQCPNIIHVLVLILSKSNTGSHHQVSGSVFINFLMQGSISQTVEFVVEPVDKGCRQFSFVFKFKSLNYYFPIQDIETLFES